MRIPLSYRRFVLFSVVFSLLFGVFSVAFGQTVLVQWESDLNAATARSEREQRPLFLHFVGNGSPSAMQMLNEVFVLPNIAAHLNANYVMVRINATENPALAQRFSVKSIPTDLIMRSNGQVVHQRVGVIPAEKFGDYLAFLQRTIQGGTSQSDRNQISVPQTANPISDPPVVSSLAVTAGPFSGQNSSSVAAHTQLAMVTAPETIDPFAQNKLPQNQHVQIQSSAVPPPSLNNNPLRPSETPTMGQMVQTGPIGQMTPPPQYPAGVAGHSVAAVSTNTGREEIIQGISANLPAPPKKTVEVPLALEGFCPVTLYTKESWVPGNPAFCTMFQGHIFRFATLEALTTFAQNPANYIPVAMGEDIVLMVDRNQRVNGNLDFAGYCQGRILLFASQETYDAFKQRTDYYMEIALRYETARNEARVPVIY